MRATLLVIAAWIFTCPVGRGTEPVNEMRFNLVDGFAIITEGQIGTANHLNFMIDTGAVPSVLSKRQASRLGATGEEHSYAMVAGRANSLKSATVPYVVIKDVHVGWAHSANLPMVVVDLRQLESALGVRVDAIIGLDMLAGQNFSIDYQHRRLIRGLSGTAQHHIDADIDYAADAPYWVISASWGGRRLRFVLDTGADGMRMFNESASGAAAGNKQPITAPVPGTANIMPPASVAITPQASLAIGDQLFKHQRPVKLDRPEGRLKDIDGLLSPSALRVRRLEFDWANKTVLWNSK